MKHGRKRFALLVALTTMPVFAEPPKESAQEQEKEPIEKKISERPHTVAELQAGVLTLPNAPVSNARRGGDTPIGSVGKGDATLQIGISVLVRPEPRFAFGAAARFAPQPTSDTEYGGERGLRRTHSRSYLSLGLEGRFIPLRLKRWEAWVGVAGGGVVVADKFSTDTGADVPTVLGDRTTAIRSEGVTVGLLAGASWNFGERWVAGAALRSDVWFLPNERGCSAIGDCASLTGRVFALQLGLSIGYRLPL